MLEQDEAWNVNEHAERLLATMAITLSKCSFCFDSAHLKLNPATGKVIFYFIRPDAVVEI